MKRLLPLLIISFMLLTGIAAAQEPCRVSITVTPFVSKINGMQHPVTQEIKMAPGDSVSIDLKVFQTVMTIDANGQNMAFSFDRDLELTAGGITADVRRIVLEKDYKAHLRTPTMDAGAWLDLSWGPDEIPLVYRDFIRSMRDILGGKENFRYGVYEDFSIMFQVQSALPLEKQTLGYTVLDIDGDGTEELLFGDRHPDMKGTCLYDMYTIREGEMVHVFDGWDRNRYYITADGEFINEGSNSAFHYFSAYYVYANDRLQLLRSVIHDAGKDRSEPWFVSYTDRSDASTGLHITQNEAETIMSYYNGKTLELTPFK